MKTLLRISLWGTLPILLYGVLLSFPQPLFAFSARSGNLTLYSDHPLEPAAAERVLRLAQQKLERSSLYAERPAVTIFICNAPWRQVLFFNRNYGVGGVAPVPLNNVFLRDADVVNNLLISPAGTPVAPDRPLDYFIAHEVTHVLTGNALGTWGFYRLPQWAREGYADYVGKGGSFDYAGAKAAFLADEPKMDYSKSGLYLRFHMLVLCALQHQHWTVEQLLTNAPSQEQAEAWVRTEPQ